MNVKGVCVDDSEHTDGLSNGDTVFLTVFVCVSVDSAAVTVIMLSELALIALDR